MPTTILVAGGAGYIGSHTVKYLLKNNYNVVVVDNLVYGHKEAVLTPNFEQIDLADKSALDRVFKKYKIDAVIHFAAFTYVGESVVDPKKYYWNNVVNTLNLLDVMIENNVKNIVFSSTCATYGNPQYTPLDENHPQNPINPYGKTKLMMEQIMADYEEAYGLKYAALRYFNAAGADFQGELGECHDPETHLIPIVLKAIKGDIPNIKVFGTDYDTPDGTCIRDYIHVEDLADAHMLALEKIFKDNKSIHINLGTGIGTSVKEIIQAAEEVTGQKVPLVYVGRREGDPAILYASNNKAKELLNWTTKYMDIKEIIKTAWLWEKGDKFKSNKDYLTVN
ncbi:MAG: UDP-glucose 4-epimerase GalE [Candidatus Gastranaerophilales bacterium]|nr:UDP-glucose 4-epimerase GalE [Candidatus Gastranaerophilales bacterium]